MSATVVKDELTSEGKRILDSLKTLRNLNVQIGFQGGAYEDGTSVAEVAAWNEFGTSRSPSRPFMRESVDKNLDRIDNMLKRQANALLDGQTPRETMEKMGLFQKSLVQESIKDGHWAPNAPSTIKRKGSSKPLIDTSHMRQSVNYQVGSGGYDGN